MRVSRIPFPSRLGRMSVLVFSLLGGTLLLALVGFVRVLSTLVRVPPQLDFGAYYVAARLLNADVGLYRPRELDDVALGIAGIQHTGYIYPPFFAVLLRPLALLPYRTAETIWFGWNLVFFVVVCYLLIQLMNVPWQWGIALTLVALLLPAVYDTWLLGQVSILLTALSLASLLSANHTSARPRRDIVAGMLLGFAAAIKIYPMLLVGIYLVHRRWWTLIGVVSSLALAGGVGIIFGGGWETTRYWLTVTLPAASSMSPFPSNQSLRGVVARFFTTNTFQVPVLNKDNYVTVVLAPLIDSPLLATIAVLVGSAVILLVSTWVMLQPSSRHRHPTLTLDVAIGTTAMLLVTPVVWDLYYVHLLLPLLLLVAVYRHLPGVQWVFASACLLLVLQRYWRYALLYVHSPWFMMSGFLAVGLLWGTLLIIRGRGNMP